MNLTVFASSLVLATLSATVASAQGAPPAATSAAPAAPTQADTSYSIGFNIGSQMKSDGITVDTDQLARGIHDAQSGAKPMLSPEQMSAAMNALQAGVMTHRREQAAQQADSNKAQGDAFLKANAARPGVVTTKSGLQYEILVKGTGPTPKATDTVVCNYKGTLVDGTEFDASDKHGGPASFPVGGVIKGWSEALQLMPVGSKWRLVLPSELAYGERGAGGPIGPNSVLIFEVELVSIKAG
jgi:FKBP-type peptidyl-prolyl cis-trans isomerase